MSNNVIPFPRRRRKRSGGLLVDTLSEEHVHVRSESFEGEWPLTVDGGTVMRLGPWIYFIAIQMLSVVGEARAVAVVHHYGLNEAARAAGWEPIDAILRPGASVEELVKLVGGSK